MKIKKQAVKDPHPTMGLDGINATLGDSIVSNSQDKTLCAGFFHLNKTDKPLVYTYDYEEMKYVAEGEFFITDELLRIRAPRCCPCPLLLEASMLPELELSLTDLNK